MAENLLDDEKTATAAKQLGVDESWVIFFMSRVVTNIDMSFPQAISEYHEEYGYMNADDVAVILEDHVVDDIHLPAGHLLIGMSSPDCVSKKYGIVDFSSFGDVK